LRDCEKEGTADGNQRIRAGKERIEEGKTKEREREREQLNRLLQWQDPSTAEQSNGLAAGNLVEVFRHPTVPFLSRAIKSAERISFAPVKRMTLQRSL